MSRLALANSMGVGLDVIEAVESGKREVGGRFLEKLARALCLSPDSIIVPLDPKRAKSDHMPAGA